MHEFLLSVEVPTFATFHPLPLFLGPQIRLLLYQILDPLRPLLGYLRLLLVKLLLLNFFKVIYYFLIIYHEHLLWYIFHVLGTYLFLIAIVYV